MFTMILEEDYEELDEVQLITINGGTCTKSTPVTTTQGGDNPNIPAGNEPEGSGDSLSGDDSSFTEEVSTKDKILDSIKDNTDGKEYIENVYQCDEWVQEVLTDAGLDYNNYLAGDAQGKFVSDHIEALKVSGDYSTTIPKGEGVYVVFMDGEGSQGTLRPHCGILEVASDGTMYFTHNSSANDNNGVDTWSVTSENNGTKLSKLAYSNFYFKEIK